MSIYKKTSSLPPRLFFSIRDVTAYLHTKRLECFLLHLSNELLTQVASLGTSSSSPPIPKLTPPEAFPILVNNNFIFQSVQVKKPWNHQPLLTSHPTSVRQLYLSTVSSKKFLTLNPNLIQHCHLNPFSVAYSFCSSQFASIVILNTIARSHLLKHVTLLLLMFKRLFT